MQNDNLLLQLKRKLSEFNNQLLRINNKEKERINFYEQLSRKRNSINVSESSILKLIENCVKKYEIVEIKILNIEGKVKKDSIKISFFGAVSAGKSRVLNTILWENLFLSAVTDTTSCFVRVCKSNTGRHYLLEDNSETPFNSIDDLKIKVREMTTHLGSETATRLATNKSVQVFLNTENKILKKNTEIVDCPGSNNKGEVTNCIKQQSLDSDIFIFVLTFNLSTEEKDFFHYQSTLSSKPDIFVLVNKWDISDKDNPVVTKKSRDKIKYELIRLLTKNGNFSSEEAEKRIFFVSAQEMFKHRVEKTNIFGNLVLLKGNPKLREAIQLRYEEFCSFEESLSKYIDNPEEKKADRHKRDIKETERDLDGIIKDFKNLLFEQLKREEFQPKKIQDFSVNFDMSNEKLLKYLTSHTENIHKNLSKYCEDFKRDLNRNNISSIGSALNTITTRVSTDLMDIQRHINEKLDEFKEDFKRVMGKHKFKEKEERPTFKSDIKKNIVLTVIPEKSLWGHFTNFFKDLFGNTEDEDEIRDILQQNIETIISVEKEMKEKVENFREKSENYILCKYSKMAAVVFQRIQYMTDYLEAMEQISN